MFSLLNKSFCYVRFCVVSKNNHKLLLDFWITFIFSSLEKKNNSLVLSHIEHSKYDELHHFNHLSGQKYFVEVHYLTWEELWIIASHVTLNNHFYKSTLNFFLEKNQFDTPNDFGYKVHIVSTTMEVKEELI